MATRETHTKHVVMLVTNDVTADSRVKKAAASAASAGFRVTVVGRSLEKKGSKEKFEGAQIVRVPVPFEYKAHVIARRRQGSPRRRLPGRSSPSRHSRRRRRSLRWRVRVQRRRGRIHTIRRRLDEGKRLPGALDLVRRAPLWALISWQQRLLSIERRLGRSRERASSEPLTADKPGRDSAPSRLARWRADWREEFPSFVDFELAYAPVVSRLRPDLIHAHDFSTLAMAERSVALERAKGREVRLLYDAHEYVAGLPELEPRRLAALAKLEREHIQRADAVITVSPRIADRLQQEHRLTERPELVLNAPIGSVFDPQSPLSVRDAAGVDRGTPLLVYSGGVKPQRGIETLVRALESLPGVHCAVVAREKDSKELQRLAAVAADEAECADRLHVVGYVPHDQVINYLRDADAGVHPLLPSGNADLALPNKLFEYMHALIPPIVSDLPAMGEFVRQTGVGETFAAGDPASLAQACERVLADRQRYRERMRDPELRRQYSWEQQAETLTAVYHRLLDEDPAPAPPSVAAADGAGSDPKPVKLGLGPARDVRRASAWARVLERHRSDVATEIFTLTGSGADGIPAHVIDAEEWQSLDWQLEWLRHVVSTHSHLLLESGSSVLGTLNGRYFDDDLPFLSSHGLATALVLSAEDVRSPREHRQLEPTSPYAELPESAIEEREAEVKELRRRLRGFSGPVFATEPEALDYLPRANWLPHPFDADAWGIERKPDLHAVPVVLSIHTGEETRTEQIGRDICSQLATRSIIKYRTVEGSHGIREAMASADIVLGEFAFGGYGRSALIGMAAGRLVIGHVRKSIRKRFLPGPPIIESRVEDLPTVLERVRKDPLPFEIYAEGGPAFVRRWHSSETCATQLAGFLETGPAEPAVG